MEQKFNYYDLGPRVVDAKPKYREGDSKKLTYNFVTDPRLRRGHNYGLNYVTSSNYDDDTKTVREENKNLTKDRFKEAKKRGVKEKQVAGTIQTRGSESAQKRSLRQFARDL